MDVSLLKLMFNRDTNEICISEDWLDKVVIELPDGTKLPLRMYLKQELVTILEEALKEA